MCNHLCKRTPLDEVSLHPPEIIGKRTIPRHRTRKCYGSIQTNAAPKKDCERPQNHLPCSKPQERPQHGNAQEQRIDMKAQYGLCQQQRNSKAAHDDSGN